MAQRSPNYPAIGLTEAVQLIERLWNEEKGSRVPLNNAVRALGFQGYSGPTRTKVSALRKYGLIDLSGDDVQITELGKQIVAPVSRDEKEAALRQAARKPELFQELRRDYPEASDQTLQSVLERQSFSASGARQAIGAYRDTIALARLDTEEDTEPDEAKGRERRDEGAETRAGGQRKTWQEQPMSVVSFQVGERIVEIAAPGDPLTKGEIEALAAYLQVASRFAPEAVATQAVPVSASPETQSDELSAASVNA